MVRRAVFVPVAAVVGAMLLPNYPEYRVEAADLPCEMTGEPTVPRAPTGVRIITSLLDLRTVLEAMAPSHEYFEALKVRPGATGFALRSQAEIDACPEAASFSTVREPIIYDPVEDAALARFWPPKSNDIKGRYLPLKVTGSFLVTWDFKFSENFRWLGEGHMARHKTWRLDPGYWLQVRTDYRHSADKRGEFSEVFITVPGRKFTVPGQSWRTIDDPGNPKNFEPWYGELLQPRVGEFFMQPNTWTRMWIYVRDFDQAVCYLSAWVADERRDPVQLYDRIALHPTDARELAQFFIEYDTSADSAKLPMEWLHSWNRNVVLLRNPGDVGPLLQRPIR